MLAQGRARLGIGNGRAPCRLNKPVHLLICIVAGDVPSRQTGPRRTIAATKKLSPGRLEASCMTDQGFVVRHAA